MLKPQTALSKRVRQLGVLDIVGGGQVVVQGDYVYIGHMKPPYGTSIVDVSDRGNPRLVTQIKLDSDASHTHKVRVNGDVMIVNVEQNDRHFRIKAGKIADAEAALAASLGRPPADKEIAARIGVTAEDVPELRRVLKEGYSEGGFQVYDVSNKSKPRLITHHKTGGIGVHRFHADARYAYISTEMDGFVGNILVVYDMKDPARPEEVSRWWMPGQHVAGGEKPTWRGTTHRLHHALRVGNELWASVWEAGFRVIDASDIRKPRTVGAYDYHPAIPEPTHTVMPFENLIGGRRIAAAIDEEHTHIHGRLHAFLWIFDVTDLAQIKPLSIFNVSELDSPFATEGRFGAHQYREKLDDTLVYATWFSGGLRIVDVKNPMLPEEVGFFIPEPLGGQRSPQSNDVTVGDDGIIYLLDRNRGLHVLELERP
jgi:hypothetical protein